MFRTQIYAVTHKPKPTNRDSFNLVHEHFGVTEQNAGRVTHEKLVKVLFGRRTGLGGAKLNFSTRSPWLYQNHVGLHRSITHP